MPKGGRIVAALLILLMVGVGAAAATLQMVSVGVLKLRAETYPDHTSYSLAYTGNDVEVPEPWTGSFYPSYIPEGFIHEQSTLHEVLYVDAKGNMLAYSETPKGGHVSYDTENASIKAVQINGAETTLIEKEGWSTVIWAANNRLFAIDLHGDAETALMIAASVTMIRD